MLRSIYDAFSQETIFELNAKTKTKNIGNKNDRRQKTLTSVIALTLYKTLYMWRNHQVVLSETNR